MRGHRGAGFAAQDVIQARERTALVIESIVVQDWIADAPARETIHNNVEFVLGRAFGRRTVPGENAFIEALYLVDNRQLHLQSRRSDGANDFAETGDDYVFILLHHKEQRSPFKCA